MADSRTLEKTKVPGIYRRHEAGCKRNGRCKCRYIVVWRQGGSQHKQMFETFELAREFKGGLDSGKSDRRPLSSSTLAAYYAGWIENYRGRTARGLEESTRREYRISFKHHILPLIGGRRMRDLAAPDVEEWLGRLERKGASPTTIRKAKAALTVMLASARQAGAIASNPARGVAYVPSDRAKREHPKRKRYALTAEDVVSILNTLDEDWRAAFTLLAQSGLRIGELFGLTWGNVHLGDDPHIMVAEQVYRGQRKALKTEASQARVPLSSSMASWLADLRPEGASPEAPVFPSTTGTALNYHNVYSRVLRPALEKSGLAIRVGEDKKGNPVWDYRGIGFHAFRKACGSLLLARGKNLKQVQGWLRHSQLTTTLNVYIKQVDDGLGGADVMNDILARANRGNSGATQHPETAATRPSPEQAKSADLQDEREQPQTAVNAESQS